MDKRARLSLYLPNDDIRRKIKIASAKQGISISDYCVKAIQRQLMDDGELSVREVYASTKEHKASLTDRMDKLREEIGPVDIPVTEMIKEGRRR